MLLTFHFNYKQVILAALFLDNSFQSRQQSESYLCTHDESYEEGDYRHDQNQQLSAVASPEGLWGHVHHRCH